MCVWNVLRRAGIAAEEFLLYFILISACKYLNSDIYLLCLLYISQKRQKYWVDENCFIILLNKNEFLKL
jgi:hypothetical protein